jgi:hypothetical protein
VLPPIPSIHLCRSQPPLSTFASLTYLKKNKIRVAYFVFFQIPFHNNVSTNPSPSTRLRFFDIFEKKQNTHRVFCFFSNSLSASLSASRFCCPLWPPPHPSGSRSNSQNNYHHLANLHQTPQSNLPPLNLPPATMMGLPPSARPKCRFESICCIILLLTTPCMSSLSSLSLL